MNQDEMVIEVCPNCEREVSFKWDVDSESYKTVCPCCGELLMICSECQDRDYGYCDWNNDNQRCYRMTKGD